MNHTRKIIACLLLLLMSTSLNGRANNQTAYLESQESFEDFIINTISRVQNRTGSRKWDEPLEDITTVLFRYTRASGEGILALLGAIVEQIDEAQSHIAKTECSLLNNYLIPGTPVLFIALFLHSPQFRQKVMLVARSTLFVGASFGITIALIEDLLKQLKSL